MSHKPVLLDEWTEEQVANLDTANTIAGHRLHQSPLFTDEGLIETLAKHPEAALGVNTMGDDPCHSEEWREGVTDGHDAATLLEAVKNGRLWLNLRRVMDHHPEYNELIHSLYDELETIVPGLHTFNRTANLLISSPTALVYYHLDCPVNILWHVRGTKRVWVYPINRGIVCDESREAVLCGEAPEELDYSPKLDELADVYDLEPGQLITWPQHTPHRVVNTSGLNVSISTEHMTHQACRLNNVYLANRHFRRMFGGGFRSTELNGFAPAAKELALRVARRIPGLAPPPNQGFNYPKTFAIDPSAPDGVRLFDDSEQTSGPSDDTTTTVIAPLPANASIDSPTGVV
ncbi:MAG: hypothetical protein AAGF31_02280 [Planctomycetota bacterium]